MNTGRGFTLIELLIAVAVLGIVASIAVPSYRQHVLRTYRTEAIAELLRMRGEQEKHFLQNDTYRAVSAVVSASGRYRFVVDVAGESFRVTATAHGAQAGDARCLEMTINERGERGASPGAVRECWK